MGSVGAIAEPEQRAGIDTVVFDLGGVLIDWDPRYLFRKLLPDDAAVERFLIDTEFEEWNCRHDAGMSWAAATEQIARTHPDYAPIFALYPQRFLETVSGEIGGSIEIVRELRASGVRLLALTNFARTNFILAQQVFGWLDEFDGLVISSHEGVAKPDHRVYRVLIDRYGARPEATAFVDDRLANVTAARELGFTSVLFEDPDQLRAELARLGLLTAGGQC